MSISSTTRKCRGRGISSTQASWPREYSSHARLHVLVVDGLLALDDADNHLKLYGGRLLAIYGGNLLLKLDDGGLPAASSAVIFGGGGLPALVHRRLLPCSSAGASSHARRRQPPPALLERGLVALADEPPLGACRWRPPAACSPSAMTLPLHSRQRTEIRCLAMGEARMNSSVP
jgi:hypothetical protein